MKNIYESEVFASMEEMSMHPGGLRLTDRAARLAGLAPGMLTADLGCGAGATAAFLASKYKLQMVGLEISQALVEAGIKKHHGLRLVRWDCETLPFEDRCLDAVIVECALSVIGRLEAVLSECARSLKSNGALIMSDVVLKNGAAKTGTQLFTTEGISALLRKSGFAVDVTEDHTPALRTYAAGLRERSAAGINTGAFFGADCTKSPPKLSELGYTLIIARKK